MLHHMEDRFQTGDVVFLDMPNFKKCGAIKPFKSPVGLHQRGVEFLEKFVFREMRPLGKLLRPIPYIRRPSNTGDDPLPDISAQMQDEVTDTVIGLVCAPPDVVIGQFVHAPFVTGLVLVQQFLPGVSEKLLTEVLCIQ